MSTLERIAHFQHRRDEVPNQELARDLAQSQDLAGIREIAENLWNRDKDIQSDCLKVLDELGSLSPELVADYCADFLKLIKSKNNRLAWGAMSALASIAALKAGQIFPHALEIQQVMAAGSVITRDNGVKTLALVAAQDKSYRREIFPYLLEHLSGCRPKDLPQHSEKCLPAVDETNKNDFILLLEKRSPDLTKSELARVKKVIKTAKNR